MPTIFRRTAPKVRDGKTQRKNRWRPTPNYYNTPQERTVIDRCRPGPGYRHALKKRDVERFVPLLPDWRELSVGLNAIVLASGRSDCDGWHRPGIVAVCAWEIDQTISVEASYFFAHRRIFTQLGVPCRGADDGTFVCEFTLS